MSPKRRRARLTARAHRVPPKPTRPKIWTHFTNSRDMRLEREGLRREYGR